MQPEITYWGYKMIESCSFQITSVSRETESIARDIVIEGLKERFGNYDYSKNPDIYDIYENYIEKGAAFLVGLLDNSIICTGALIKENETTGRIVRMSVDKKHRSMGFAEKMIEELEKAARKKGYGSIAIETNHDWYSAIKLYKRCGYIECGRDEESMHFIKSITAD